MSWEGYEEGLCLNGHLDRWGCSIYAQPAPKTCWFCSAPYAQVWTVDETNGCQEVLGRGVCICGKRDLEMVEETKAPLCPTCGEPRYVPAVYKFVPEVYAGHEWKDR